MCQGHYQQTRRGSRIAPVSTRPICTVDGCGLDVRARGLCGGHYQQIQRGKPIGPIRPRIKSLTRNKQGNKRCSKCFKWKDPKLFHSCANGNEDGLQSYCAKCDRDMRLLRNYGITGDMYDSMLARQGGTCAICLRPPLDGQLHVDHDHQCCAHYRKSCGKCVRGLLCTYCNRAIGMLGDDQARLIRAVEYLRASSST